MNSYSSFYKKILKNNCNIMNDYEADPVLIVDGVLIEGGPQGDSTIILSHLEVQRSWVHSHKCVY